MNYSRRQLYAMGEPLGDSATYRKADGGLVLGGGGGGGGSAPANTTSQQTSTVELPEWARPYAKDVLAKGQALTDVNQNPYQQYTGDRIAGFSPMQQQAMQNAKGMSVAPQVGQGTAAATMAGLGGLDVAGQANVGGFQNQVGGYMNPYINQILAPQLAEANRNYDIGAVKQQQGATQAGAFGGSREAIMAAENERNRNTGLNQIYGQGLNTAYTNAQNQYNQNNQTQLAGYGLANQAAGQLGQLGQQQYQQNMGINQLQAQYGGQQQALQQQGLTQAYQDFTNQQNYPYKQLGFMSDMIRGLPLGQQSTAAVYQPPPSALQTMGALGLGAYGAKQLGMFAEGGEVKTYAGDKESVTSSGNIERIIGTLNLQQLQDAFKNAQARGDRPTAMLIAQQIEKVSAQEAEDQSMQNGIAGTLPNQMADGIVNAAGGGILAFKEGGIKRFNEDGLVEGANIQLPQFAGDPALYKKFGNRALASIDAYSNVEAPAAYTPQEEDALDARSMARARKLIGPSPYAGMNEQLEDLKTQGKEALQQGKGLAALAAMEGMLQPGGALRGIGRAGKNFVEAYAPAVRADQDLRKSTAVMNINLANAQRAENMGLGKEAMAYTNQAIAAKKEAAKAERELALKEAELNIKGATAFRPPAQRTGAGAGGKPKAKFDEDTAAMIDKVVDLKRNPKADPNEIKALEDKIAGRTTYKTNVKDLPTNKKELETDKLELTTEAKAAEAWKGKSRKEKKAFAAENGILTGVDNPGWAEQAAKKHNAAFGKGNANPASAPNPKVIKLD